jgi:hypothetical protein
MDRDTKTKPDEQPQGKHESKKPSAQWQEIAVGAWQDFSPRYLANLVFLIIGILIAPGIGLLMNTKKSVIYGMAAGVTILIWLFAYHLAKRAEGQSHIGGRSPATQEDVNQIKRQIDELFASLKPPEKQITKKSPGLSFTRHSQGSPPQ